VMPRELAEQIAAGEVVESPSSVVKELVENSLDAGATSLEVKIKGSGLKEISVFDNGLGLDSREIPLAFQRHATSKLDSLEELYSSLNTLGFRGEALPSIAAVSRVTFTSRSPEQLSGSSYRIEGGREVSHEETGCPSGTEVMVKDLFFNTPARRKFAKSTREVSRINQLITALAFSHPRVAFSLWNEGKAVFKTAGDGSILNVITEAYGREVSRAMLPLEESVDLEEGELKFSGYISAPYLSRSSRRYQNIIVNDRLVRSSLITHALERGYRGLLHAGRFPVAVVYLQLPASFLDVNIHPSKSEVRFHSSRELNEIIHRAVKNALGRSSTVYYLKEERKEQGTSSHAHDPSILQEINFHKTGGHEKSGAPEQGTGQRLPSPGEQFPSVNENHVFSLGTGTAENITLISKSSFKVIGQYLSSYIVTQKENNLVLIDQHAAHERVLFEQFTGEHRQEKLSRAPLAVPVTLEIPFSWEEGFPLLLPQLEEAGFKLEPFGYNTYIVREIPAFLVDKFNELLLRDMIEEMLFSERYNQEELEDVYKLFSCKGAVKANQRLSHQEMETLVKDWEKTRNSGYCPHGRPVSVTLGIESLNRGFRRKGGE